jgi:hypothetical protein
MTCSAHAQRFITRHVRSLGLDIRYCSSCTHKAVVWTVGPVSSVARRIEYQTALQARRRYSPCVFWRYVLLSSVSPTTLFYHLCGRSHQYRLVHNRSHGDQKEQKTNDHAKIGSSALGSAFAKEASVT